MSCYRVPIAMCLALSVWFPSAAATVFWPFGFHFPNSEQHYAGGLAAAAQPAPTAVASEIRVSQADDLQIEMPTDRELVEGYDVADLGESEVSRLSMTDSPADGEYIGN